MSHTCLTPVLPAFDDLAVQTGRYRPQIHNQHILIRANPTLKLAMAKINIIAACNKILSCKQPVCFYPIESIAGREKQVSKEVCVSSHLDEATMRKRPVYIPGWARQNPE